MIGHYGGDLAGPVFRRVAEASLRYLGVPPSGAAPKVKVVTREDDPAYQVLSAFKNDQAKEEAPPAPTAAAPLGPPLPSSVLVPNANGLGARDAVKALGAAGLVPLVEGSGRLVKQIPAAGTPVPKGTSVRLVFERDS